MKELLYFSFSDLLVKVEYSKETNSLEYASHRDISFGERVVIEQYLLSNIALKTEYYNHCPGSFIYLGKDKKLVRDLNLFHLKNSLKTLAGRDKEVKQQVNDLVARSMSNYYFEQIGDEIVGLRKMVDHNFNDMDFHKTKAKMKELIKAYNLYSHKEISMEDVIPVDLKEVLQVN